MSYFSHFFIAMDELVCWWHAYRIGGSNNREERQVEWRNEVGRGGGGRRVYGRREARREGYGGRGVGVWRNEVWKKERMGQEISFLVNSRTQSFLLSHVWQLQVLLNINNGTLGG